MSNKENTSLEWGKLILPILLPLLVGSEIWQYWSAPDKIKADTKSHVDQLLVQNLEKKLDSISYQLAKKEFAAKSLESAVSAIKGTNGVESNKYLMQVFHVADEAIKNDSVWRNRQRPFIEWLVQHEEDLQFVFDHKVLAPMVETSTDRLVFNWLDGLYPITEKQVNGGIIRSWRDKTDDKHTLISISKIKDQ
jgi:hypothetical protein